MNPKLHSFLTIGFGIANVQWNRSVRSRKLCNKHQETEWTSSFVIHPLSAYDMWLLMKDNKKKAQMKHLLWTLYFMGSKDAERKIARNLNVDRKTLSKWTGIVFELINKKYSEVVSRKHFFFLQKSVYL